VTRVPKELRGQRDKLKGDFSRDELERLPAERLVVVSDFRLELSRAGSLGSHIVLESTRLGRLASFSYWDHAERDLKVLAIDKIPCAHPNSHYEDQDQGWQLILMRREVAGVDEVWAFEGGEEWSELEVGFRVPAALWVAAWQQLIRRCGGR
jgi:hypothetical protein